MDKMTNIDAAAADDRHNPPIVEQGPCEHSHHDHVENVVLCHHPTRSGMEDCGDLLWDGICPAGRKEDP